MHDIVTRAPQLIDSVLDDADPLNNDLDDVFNVDPDSQHGVMERARRLVSLWTRVNVKRAAMTPPLLLGTIAVGDLVTALNNHPNLMQTVENERSELNQKKSQLQTTTRRTDRNNTRWYGAWGNNFADGSPEKNAMLSQVDTEEGTNPPTALEIATVTQSGGQPDRRQRRRKIGR